ncbi:MAG: ComEC family competence protein, partial [Candidatus Latescibacteria bacterium]|nr:ComEC family competence protein [Candidatus Latescibacterota bacterium]
MRRPALLAALCFATGMFLQVIFSFQLLWVFACIACVLIMLMVGFAKELEKVCSVLLCLLLLLLGGVRFDVAVNKLLPGHYLQVIQTDEIIVQGVLVSEPEVQARGWRAEMEIENVCRADTLWQTSGRMLISFRDGILLAGYGDSLCLRIRPTLPEPSRNPGGFDYRRYLSLRGIRALAYVKRSNQIMGRVSRQWKWWKRGIVPVRLLIRQTIEQNLSGGPAGLLKGVLLGDKRAVPEEVRKVFTRCGVNHVLAVSGLHVGLIAGVIFFGLKLCGIGRWITAWVTVLLLVVYALVTGLPPSVIRASLMASLVIFGSLGEWETDGWNALGVAGLVGLIARPADILNVGFQLSFVATGGILMFYRPILDLLPKSGGRLITNTVWSPLAVSFAAQLATMPLIVTYFGVVSVIGILANLIVVPLIGLAAALGVVSVFVFLLSPDVVIWLNGANWAVLKLAIGLAEIM